MPQPRRGRARGTGVTTAERNAALARGAGGGAAGTGPYTPTSGPALGASNLATGSTYQTAADPAVGRAIGRYEGRFDASNLRRTTNNAVLGAADAAELAVVGQRGDRSRSGVLNSGAGANLDARIRSQGAAAGAREAAGIAERDQARLDNLSLGGTALVTAPDAIRNTQVGTLAGVQNQTWNQNFQTAEATRLANQAALDRIAAIYGSA